MIFQNCDESLSTNNPKNISENLKNNRCKSLEKKNLSNRYNKEDKNDCGKKSIPNISGDDFIPKHEFHIYHYRQDEKTCQSYPTVTTDTEENKSDSINRKTKIIPNETNTFYNEDETTDTESSEIRNEESLEQEPIVKSKTKKHSPYNPDNRKFESPNYKTVYFKEQKSRTKIPIKLYKNLIDCEQYCRVSSSRQKRKIRSDQHLKLSKNRVQSSEPQITSNQRLSKTSCLKKANSYLSRCTNEVTPNSETSCAPKNREVKSLSINYRANVSIKFEEKV